MRLYVYEGTPDELGEVVAKLPPLAGAKQLVTKEIEIEQEAVVEEEVDERVFVTTKVARLALTRRPLSENMKIILNALYKAHPTKLQTSKLEKLTRLNGDQFRGTMGAFGNRVASTPGYKDSWFFDQVWDHAGGFYWYGLPDTSREALVLEKLV